MSRWKRLVPVAVALIIPLGITAAFAMGMFAGDDDEEPVDIEQDENRTPSPTVDVEQDETLPNNETQPTNQFAEGGNLEFENVASAVRFDYESEFRGRGGQISQSGVYVVDYDNDGDEDLLATGGTNPTLFENIGGAFDRERTFDHPRTHTAHFLDYDNDGWRDLVLGTYAGSIHFYENNEGTFEHSRVGLDRSVRNPTTITSADFTGNGCLDLFVGQNGPWQQGPPVLQNEIERVQNNPDARPTTAPGGENILFYGDCDSFQEATDQAGIYGRNWTLAASAADFTGDGYVDIHVGNDLSADFLYVNQGDGTFERYDLGPETDRNAMASVARDVNNDGHVDLFVSNIYATESTNGIGGRNPVDMPNPDGNNLFINTGEVEDGEYDDLFVDVATEHDVDEGGWGWAASISDFNNDGHLDIIHATSGDLAWEPYDRFRTPQIWLGTTDSWESVNEREVGLAEHQSRGLARLDYDGDGSLDFALATTSATHSGGGPPRSFALYENQFQSNEWLQLFVRNPSGIERGAVVIAETSERTVQREVNARAGFMSQDSRLVHFGTANEEIQTVRVLWPDGSESSYDDLQEGNRYVLTPDSAEPTE